MALRFYRRDMLAAMKVEATNVPKRVGRSLTAEMSKELEEMKRRTPVWNPARKVPAGHVPGTLRASGKLIVMQNGDQIRAEISFGGLAEDYAFFVHEDVEAFHATGQDHFMSSVLDESRPYMAARVANGARLKSSR